MSSLLLDTRSANEILDKLTDDREFYQKILADNTEPYEGHTLNHYFCYLRSVEAEASHFEKHNLEKILELIKELHLLVNTILSHYD